MVRLLFRIKRKAGNFFTSLHHSFRISEWKALYPGRFAAGTQLSFGKLFSIHFDASASNIQLGNNIQFRDFCQLRSGMDGKLTVGDRVFFNNNCSVHCFYEIVIGNDCQFGEGVKFYDVNHNFKKKELLISEQGYSKGTIQIGSNCWFGSNVIILKNVTIGDNVVIGANCVIYESIPSGSVVTNTQEVKLKTNY